MGKPVPPVLYHYTSEIHLPAILRSGHLRLTDSNIGFDGSGPKVVWLTTTTDPGGNGLDGGFDKGAVRLTIDASGLPVHHWPTWSFEQGIEGFWYDALDSAGGGGSENWWVCTREIPLDRVLTIEVNGVPYKDWGTGRHGSLAVEGARPEGTGRTKTITIGDDEIVLCHVPRMVSGEQGIWAGLVTVSGREHEVGYLTWRGTTIGGVYVADFMRRQGVATAMLAFAREITPGLKHSTTLLPDGRAWSQAVGSLSTEAAYGDPQPPVSVRGRWIHQNSSPDPIRFDRSRNTRHHYGPGLYLAKEPGRWGEFLHTFEVNASRFFRVPRMGGPVDEVAPFLLPHVAPQSVIDKHFVDVTDRDEWNATPRFWAAFNAVLDEMGAQGLLVGDEWLVVRDPSVIREISVEPYTIKPLLGAKTSSLFDGYSDEDVRAHLQQFPNDKPHIFERDEGFMALWHGMPVGQLVYTIEQDERVYDDDEKIADQAKGDYNGYYAKIDHLVVHREARRRGIGTALLKAFIKMADNRYGYTGKPEDRLGWDPGGFTRDGAALWKAVMGETVPVTQNITYSSLTAAADWKRSPGGNSYRTSTVGKNGITYYVTGSFESFKAFWERPAEDGYASPQWCGSLSVWSGLSGGGHEVFKVQVNPEHRRQGVASAMFDLAKVDHPDLTHAGPGALSEDGKGFAAGHPASLRTAADEQQVEVSGVALVARDTGRVLMLQRALTVGDDNGGKWEFPGGHHEEGDITSLHAAIREWEEEVGQRFPEGGEVVDTWTSPDGIYRGHIVAIDEEAQLALHVDRVVDNPDEDGFEQAAWWDPEDAKKNPALREECKATPWSKFKIAPKEGRRMHTDDEWGSLFDPVPLSAPVVRQAAQQHTASEWGDDLSYAGENFAFAGPNVPHPGLGHTMNPEFVPLAGTETIDDDPEAALPVTYGEDDDALAQQVAAALAHPARPSAPFSGYPGDHTHTITPQARRESEEERGRRLLAYADAIARGEQPEGPNPFAHVVAGQADNEIAAAAQSHLATKTALKTYDPMERQAIIDEGADVRAGNLDRLDIAGTHYEALAATTSSVPEDEDMTFLDGDPNLD